MACIEDYDLVIGAVTLAQLGDMSKRPYGRYAQGRQVCGLVVGLTGAALYTLHDGKTLTLSGGEAALISAASRYTVRAAGEAGFAHYTVNFTVLEASEGAFIPSEGIEIVRANRTERWKARLDALLRAWNGRLPGYALRCRSELYALLSEFFDERMRGAAGGAAYEKTLPALRLMESRYADHLTLQDLAAACALSETHFRRLFRQVYGAAPIDYLLDLRLKRADDLLMSGRCTVAEAALETGFRDESYFCRCFRRRTGISPGRRAQAAGERAQA